MQHHHQLGGSICLVTGAGKGIGRAIALGFAKAGAQVAILDNDREAALSCAAEAGATGNRAMAVHADTSDADSIAAARDEIARTLGAPTVLVNNAGILGKGGRVLDLSPADWQRLIDINLTGYFLCARAFVPAMLAAGTGALVHIGSITGGEPMPGGGNYSVAKAGVAMFSKLLAAELGPQGIRSNLINPGFIATPMTRASYDRPDVAEDRSAMVPSGRIGTPEDIAAAALYLASPAASYVNGAEILVDGGLSQNLFHRLPRSA